MYFYNKLLERLILPAADTVIGSRFYSELVNMRAVGLAECDYTDKLKKLLIHATEKTVYYKKYKSDIDNPYQWLSLFPILEKSDIVRHSSDLVYDANRKLIINSSSGSTGEQTTIFWSEFEQAWNRATQVLWWEWAGFRLGDPVLQTGINPRRSPVKKVKDLLLNTYYLQAFTHSKNEVIDALRWASRKNNPVLAGYASSLYVIACIAEESGIELSFKTAISWGDKLFHHYRKKIESVFSTKVFETYGSGEGLMIAAQYDLDRMYIMTPNVYIEIVDDKGNAVPDGTLGHVIVTNLNGYSMPLIRYRIGDLAIKMPAEAYPKNRLLSLPILEKVIGRDTDIVKTRSGKYMVVHSFTGIFEHIPQIRQFCVIQENLDGIVINFIKGDGFTEDCLEMIRNKIINNLGELFEVKFRSVDFIAPTKSGKPQLIISKLATNVQG